MQVSAAADSPAHGSCRKVDGPLDREPPVAIGNTDVQGQGNYSRTLLPPRVAAGDDGSRQLPGILGDERDTCSSVYRKSLLSHITTMEISVVCFF